MGGAHTGQLERGHSVVVAPLCPRSEDVPGAIFLFFGVSWRRMIKGCGGADRSRPRGVKRSSPLLLWDTCVRAGKTIVAMLRPLTILANLAS